jgi:hypothetical protein
MLKLIPFNAEWITNSRTDLKAIYRRPQLQEDEETGDMVQKRDANGQPLWDITTGLPVKQHVRWAAKGFEYITLANRESLNLAARTGTLIGGTVRDYDQHARGGPWNYRKYIAGQELAVSDAVDVVKADVERFGPEAAEEIQRRSNPGYRLPEGMRKAKKGQSEKVPA